MAIENSSKEWVPSKEGENIIGVKRQTFFYYVESEQIRKKEMQGEPDLYNYEDILKVKDKRNKKKGKISTEVDWMKPSDLPAILKLDYEVYKEEMVGDVGLYISWYKKNPNITIISFEKGNRDRILSYLSLVPLKEEIILSIIKEERTELTIKPEEIETYEKGGSFNLLAESVVTHPDHSEQLNRVISKALEYWCKQYPKKQIDKIYAQAASEDGDVLVRKLFFSPLYNLADNAYVLDLKRKGASVLVRRFQECLKKKSA